MLSPFLSHLQEYVARFHAYAVDSKSKTNSTANQVGTFAARFVPAIIGKNIKRDEDLSTLQEKNALELYHFITDIDHKKINDETLFTKVSDLLTKLTRTTRLAVTQSKGEEGTSFLLQELELFQTRLTEARKYFLDYGLGNQKANGTPHVVVKSALAEYMINKAVFKHGLEIKYYTYTGWLRNWTFDPVLSAKKEGIVKSYLDDPEMLSLKKATDLIDSLIAKDRALLDIKKIETSLPVTVVVVQFNIPTFLIYNPKTLHDVLHNAKSTLSIFNSTTSPVFYASPTAQSSPRITQLAVNNYFQPVSSDSNNNNATPITVVSPTRDVVAELPVQTRSNHDDDDDDDGSVTYYVADGGDDGKTKLQNLL